MVVVQVVVNWVLPVMSFTEVRSLPLVIEQTFSNRSRCNDAIEDGKVLLGGHF